MRKKSEVKKMRSSGDKKIITSQPLSLSTSLHLCISYIKSHILFPAAYRLLPALLIVGCASAPGIEETSKDIVWPKPPDTARIRFIKSVSKSEDIAETRELSWIKRAWKFLAGDTSEKELAGPYGISVDNEGTIYVADRDAREIFSFNLRSKKSSLIFHESDDIEDYPIGVAAANNIYVSYPNSARIIEFARSGKVLSEIGKGILQRPTGVAADQDKGFLYAVDTLGHDVKVFDLKGKLLFTFGKRGDKEGEFNYPTHIFLAKDDTVYITDELNFRIQAFTRDGKFLFTFGKLGTVPGTLQSPKGVAADSEGNIYITDAVADIIQVFDRQGRLLLRFGGSGSEDGMFAGPVGMFIDRDDKIYITDLYNRRVQIFQYLRSK